MSVFRRGNSWVISFTDPNGKRRRRSFRGVTKRTAQDKLAEIRQSIVLGTFEDEQRREDPTFEEFAREFTEWFRKRSKSRDAYDYLIRP